VLGAGTRSDQTEPGGVDLREALEQIGDGFVVLDREWRYVYLNGSAEAVVGRDRTELIGRVLWDVFPDLRGTEAEALYRRAAAGAEPIEAEIAGLVVRRWFAVRLLPWAGGLAISFRDITEHRRALDALRESEARLRAIFDHTLDGIMLTAPSGEILAANPAACRMLGRTEDELRAVGRAGVVDQADPRVPPFLEERRRTGKARGEMTMVRKDGSVFPAGVTSSVFSDRDGRERTSLVVRDLTERKRAEAALRLLTDAGQALPASLEPEATLRAIALLALSEFADVVVVDLLDEAGIQRFVDVRDPAAHRVMRVPRLGAPRSHGVTRVLVTGVAELVPELDDAWLRAAAEDEDQLAGARALAVDSAIIVPMVARGARLGALSLLRRPPRAHYDDADRKVALALADRAALALDNARLYAESVDARRRRDEMLGIVSHDVRNPLNVIRLSAELLGRRSPSREVEAIRTAVARADRLVQDLLAITAIESGRLPLERQPVAVRDVLAEVVELHRSLADTAEVALEIEVAADLPPIWGERHRILQALGNLVGNALRYAPPQSAVLLRGRAVDGAVALDVIDHGPGIDAADLPRLFDRLQRRRASTHGGLGLGLAIVKGIAEAHGGSVRVASERGGGAVFTIILPVVAPT
jgi:PAS domain S-box-containing protein